MHAPPQISKTPTPDAHSGSVGGGRGPLARGHPCLRDPKTWLTGPYWDAGAGWELGGCSRWPPQAHTPSCGLCPRPQALVPRGLGLPCQASPAWPDSRAPRRTRGGPVEEGERGASLGCISDRAGSPFPSHHRSSARPSPSAPPPWPGAPRRPANARVSACPRRKAEPFPDGGPGRAPRGADAEGPLPIQALAPPTRWPSERLPGGRRGWFRSGRPALPALAVTTHGFPPTVLPKSQNDPESSVEANYAATAWDKVAEEGLAARTGGRRL